MSIVYYHPPVVLKRELNIKANLLIYQLICIPTLARGHELWVMKERMRWFVRICTVIHRACFCNTGEGLQYQLSFTTATGTASELYDIVVLATPLQASVGSGVQFQGFTPPFDELPGSYHSTVATIVHGYLNTSFFGFPDPRLFPFASVLTTDTPDLFFNSVASVCPVNISAGFRRKQPQEAGVYKVFSPQLLEKSQLKTLFRSAMFFPEVDPIVMPGQLCICLVQSKA